MTSSHQELICRLIEEGPDPLVFEICHRLTADRTVSLGTPATNPLTWPEIAAWAYGLMLLNEEEASLLSNLGSSTRLIPQLLAE